MKRFFMSIFAIVFLMISLFSCAREDRNAVEILSSIMAKTEGIPVGNIYIKNAKEGEKAYFSESLCESMYGSSVFELLTLTEDFSIYMASVSAPYEIAVFKCYSSTDAEKIAAVCAKRAEALRVLLSKTEWKALCDSAKITVDGRTVIMSVTGN